jgi:hypothetical protein
MRALPTCLLLLALLGVAAGEQARGLKPRAKAADYPVSQHQTALAIGAELLSNSQVQHAFATELDKRYIVVEIGVFPAGESAVKLVPEDFVLRVAGTKQIIRPAAPKTIAAVLYKNPPSSRDLAVYPTTEVGYETGGRDVYGNQHPGGWSTRVGAGVGIGSTRQQSTDNDRKVMETELQDKSLPEGEAKHPVAGYLYFPVSSSKTANYELECSSSGQTLKLALPTPAK